MNTPRTNTEWEATEKMEAGDAECHLRKHAEKLERELIEQVEMLREIHELSEVVGGQEDIRKKLIRFFANA